MLMNSLPRWLISITDMPLPCQSSISAAAVRNTSSGSTAGPGLKLNTRIGEPLSSARRPRRAENRHYRGLGLGFTTRRRVENVCAPLAGACVGGRCIDRLGGCIDKRETMTNGSAAAWIAGLAAAMLTAAPVALAQTTGANQTQLKRGEYLVTFGGCHDCHSP